MNNLIKICLLTTLTLNVCLGQGIHRIYLNETEGYFFPKTIAEKAEAYITLGKDYPRIATAYQDVVENSLNYRILAEQRYKVYRDNVDSLKYVIYESNQRYETFNKKVNEIYKENVSLRQENKALRRSRRNKWYIIGGLAALYIIHLSILNSN